MKTFARVSLTSLFLASVSTAALAADFEVSEPTAAVPYDWSGGYFGVQGGGVFGNDITGTTFLLGVPLGTLPAPSQSSFLGGIMGGYNFQNGNIVFGIDNDFSLTGLNYPVTGSPTALDLNTLSTARVRVGYAFDRVLPYVTAGLAYSIATFDVPAIAGQNSDTNVDFGWTVGAGLEYAVTDNIRIRGQYNYIDLGENEFDDFGPANPGITVRSEGVSAHVVRAGVSIRTKAIIDAVLRR